MRGSHAAVLRRKAVEQRVELRLLGRLRLRLCDAELGAVDATADELAFFERERVVAKDMEATAIASVARDWSIPFLAVKTVTDLVDHPEPSHEQFLRNLSSSCEHLTDLLSELIHFIGQGTSLSELRGETADQ